MDKIRTIKIQYEQNHYRKQRELIDAGKLDYWSLSQNNREQILQQCKDDAIIHKDYFFRKKQGGKLIAEGGHLDEWSVDNYYTTREPQHYPRTPLEEKLQEQIDALQKQIKSLEDNNHYIKQRYESTWSELQKALERANAKSDQVQRLLEDRHTQREGKFAAQKATIEEKIALLEDIRKLSVRHGQ